MADVEAMIEVFAGTFDTQPAVFAHILSAARDQGLAVNLDEVEVICRVPPERRLLHYFDAETMQDIIDQAGLRTTIVLVLPAACAEPFGETEALRRIGQWRGVLRRG